jgi:LPXTG-motif cell wall-anchored protein
MRRFFAVSSAGFACFLIALVPATRAGAAGDPVVTMPADCGGPTFCFTPSTLTITDGDTVTWSNQSGTQHIVSRCDPAQCDGVGGGTGTDSGFTFGDVPSGSTYAHTFHGPGTYTYYCSIHGYAAMHGVIVVNAAPTTTAPTATTAPPTTAPSIGAPSTTAASAATTASAAAAGSGPNPGAPSTQLAHTGSATGSPLAVGLGALVLGLAAWGVCTRKRGVVPR